MGIKNDLKYEKVGNVYQLSRKQWNGKIALISDYPNLLQEVLKYTWTFSNGYLKNLKLSISLHQFVLQFLYGKEKLLTFLSNDCIIEHLDNDGLNCCYDNLHIITADYNKAKAFTVDKFKVPDIPSFIIDAFYSHKGRYYQLQVTFNDNMFNFINNDTKECLTVEAFYLRYNAFIDLFVDWLYIFNLKGKNIEPEKLHANKLIIKTRPKLEISQDEQEAILIKRNNQIYLKLDTSGGPKTAYISRTVFKEIE